MTTRDPSRGSTRPAATAATGTAGVTPATPDQSPSDAQMSGTADQAAGAAGAVVDQAKEKAGELVGQAREQAKPRVESQKQRAADSLGSTAHALRQTSRQLRDQEEGTIAQYAERAAGQVERFADYLREHDVNELIGETERFARRQPVLFVGGAFALGLLAARFLKSSGQRGGSGTEAGAGQQLAARGYRSAAAYPPAPSAESLLATDLGTTAGYEATMPSAYTTDLNEPVADYGLASPTATGAGADIATRMTPGTGPGAGPVHTPSMEQT